MKTVGDVSALAGITVRTLHHYDERGLLSPSSRSDAGYRLYSERDLERLQEILGWRALGFSLDEIGELLDAVGHDRLSALRTQRELVFSELARLAGLARALEQAIATVEHGDEQQEETMFTGFDPIQHQDEVRERWGHTNAYKESARRVASYREQQWGEIEAEAREIERLFAELKRSGQPADGEPARAAAEQARLHIDRRFYPCSREMHRALGEMYVADPRFAATYEKAEPGLAAYVRDAIAANAGECLGRRLRQQSRGRESRGGITLPIRRLEARNACENLGVGSAQTLSEADRRIVAAWAADCAERVLGLFEAQAPHDRRPRDAIARTRAFARGELGIAEEIRRRFVAGGAARDVKTPAAVAAARAAGQATAIAHMGAHALGAAAYAAKAAGLAAPDQAEAVGEEIRWQLGRMSAPVRAALRKLPPVGENASGPLGPGLLASGLLGKIICDLQASLRSDVVRRPTPRGIPQRLTTA
jgi:DNA-binding transcriptional MerR regulator